MDVNAGVHVRQIVQLENGVNEIVASSKRLMCLCNCNKTVAIVHFDEKIEGVQ